MATNNTPNSHPFIVLMEDAPLHTQDHPFCGDSTCGCAKDHDLLEEYIFVPLNDGTLTVDEAVQLYKNRQVGA